MLNRLFRGVDRARGDARMRRCRLTIEQLEDRLVPATAPAVLGVETQALADPANLGSGTQYQVITTGTYQRVASQTVTVGPGQTGLVDLHFQAQAFAGLATRVGVRYLIDGQVDPNDAVFSQ